MQKHMRRITIIGLVLAVIALVPAVVSAQMESTTVELNELNDSGVSGTAVLTPMGEQTEVVVTLEGEMLDTARPNHIHAGTCDNLGGVEYPLETVTTEATTVVDVPLGTLLDGEFAINVHKSADEAGTFIACGNIEALMMAPEVTPSVTVSDQAIEDGTVTVDQVVAAEAGWIVIHADDDGPGPVVGHSAVQAGENNNVVVDIDTANATSTLYAMLHVDAGEMGTYEFPGPDGPVTVDGQVVTPAFSVTGMPEAMPETGGVSAAWLGLAVAGLLLLAAGFVSRRVLA